MFDHELQGKPYTPGPAWDGGVVKGKKRQPIWPKIARFMLENGLDPLQSMYRYFEYASKTGRVPWPNQMMTDECLQVCQAPREETVQDFDNLWESERERAVVRIRTLQQDFNLSARDATRRLLLDKYCDLSPLFCYSLAHAIGDEAIKQRYYVAARCQFVAYHDKFLESVWRRYIPEELMRGYLHRVK
jgi:hypothetical protein